MLAQIFGLGAGGRQISLCTPATSAHIVGKQSTESD
jgi:hypothetical protein